MEKTDLEKMTEALLEFVEVFGDDRKTSQLKARSCKRVKVLYEKPSKIVDTIHLVVKVLQEENEEKTVLFGLFVNGTSPKSKPRAFLRFLSFFDSKGMFREPPVLEISPDPPEYPAKGLNLFRRRDVSILQLIILISNSLYGLMAEKFQARFIS